jgi:hypothetical protein
MRTDRASDRRVISASNTDADKEPGDRTPGFSFFSDLVTGKV